MADKKTPTDQKMFAVGSEWWPIREGVPRVEFVDFVVEARQGQGIICLSFGSGIQDANGGGEITVASRLRMNVVTAQFLHKMLGDMISDMLKPADKSKAN